MPHCAIDDTDPPKCHRVLNGARCQGVNPWIEFLSSHGGQGLSRAQLSEEYAMAKQAHADVIPPPYSIRGTSGSVDVKEQVCAFTRARQERGKDVAKASVQQDMVRAGYVPPGEAVRTVFLMLIHSTGVAHPELWEEYLRTQGPSVALCVHCDPQHPRAGAYRAEFVRRRRMSIQVPVQWGHESLVDATIQSLEEILTRYPRLEHVVLCSGTDIPLSSVSRSDAVGHGSRNVTAYRGFYVKRDNTRFVQQLRQRAGAQAATYEPIFRVLEFHHQWMAICRSHARALVDNREEIMERFRPVQRLIETERLNMAPDEWYPIAAIRLYSQGRVREHITTATYFAKDGDRHPITFVSLARHVRVNQGEANEETTSLGEILQEVSNAVNRRGSRKIPIALTLRKVNCANAGDVQSMTDTLMPIWAK
jgi:hypothetical protein